MIRSLLSEKLRKTALHRFLRRTLWWRLKRGLESCAEKIRSPACISVRYPSNDIPDEQAARLVILRPEDNFRRANWKDSGKALTTVVEFLNTRGASPRVYRNMLAFVAPDQDKLRDLQTEVKRFIAWKSILSDKDDLNLDGGQLREAESSLNRSNSSVETRMKENLLLAVGAVYRPVRRY